MYTGLLHLHSSLRYFILLFIVLTVLDAIVALSTGRPAYGKTSKLLALLALIFTHVQVVLGLVLYFIGARGFNAMMTVPGFMSEPAIRFFAVEHVVMMIIAVTLITIGYSRAKRQSADRKKYSGLLVFYGIALVIIFVMIPWPFLKEFGTWM